MAETDFFLSRILQLKIAYFSIFVVHVHVLGGDVKVEQIAGPKGICAVLTSVLQYTITMVCIT